MASNLTLSGDSTERPSKAQASLVKMLQISAHWLVSSRLRYGEFSMPWRRYTRLPMRIWISAGTQETFVGVTSHQLCRGVCVCWPLWCWEAKGWKCLAYCRASICLPIPPLSRLIKYKRCSLNSRLLLRSKRRCRFVTAHLMRHRHWHSQIWLCVVLQRKWNTPSLGNQPDGKCALGYNVNTD